MAPEAARGCVWRAFGLCLSSEESPKLSAPVEPNLHWKSKPKESKIIVLLLKSGS